ncbi:MAG: TonB family protein [Bacteroidota bacterium]
MRGYVLLFCLGLLWVHTSWGQGAEDEPDINEFIFVEEEAKPINLAEVNQTIGYPDSARIKGIEGRVVARILVDEEGNYLKHQITGKADSLLVVAVEEHISELKFSPAKNGGKVLKYWVNIPFNFKLDLKSPQEQAIDYLTALMAEKGETYMGYLQRGLQYLEIGQFESALADFDKSLAMNPAPESEPDSGKSFRVYAYYGRAKAHSSSDKWVETLSDLNSAIAIAESDAGQDSLIASTLPNMYSDRGFAQFTQEKFDGALEDYSQAVSLAPQNACEVYTLIADVYIARDQFKELVATYDKIIECKPNDKLITYSRGFYRMELGDYQGAVEDFHATVDRNLDPNVRIAALNSSSQANLRMENYEGALKDLEEALVINVLNAKTYFLRAKVYLAQGNTEGLCKDLGLAMDYGLEDQSPEDAQEAQNLKEENCQ